jgi:hypothetical protein
MVAPINTIAFIRAHNIGGLGFGLSIPISNLFSVGKP